MPLGWVMDLIYICVVHREGVGMSVLLNFSIFPTDKGGSGLSVYVARVERAIRALGHVVELGPMSTVVETPGMDEALEVIRAAHAALAADCERIYLSVNMDIRRGGMGRMHSKVASVERHLGEESIA